METMEAILTRRSIRKFKGDPVPQDLLDRLLEAAMSAPSAGNEQVWEFVVLTDRRLLDEIPTFHPFAQMLKTAPAAILICGDLSRRKYEGFWVQDCAAATQNVLLAAHALGFGAVWVGVHPNPQREEPVRRLVGLPDHVTPLSLIPLGYPAEHVEPAHRFDPKRVHHNGW